MLHVCVCLCEAQTLVDRIHSCLFVVLWACSGSPKSRDSTGAYTSGQSILRPVSEHLHVFDLDDDGGDCGSGGDDPGVLVEYKGILHLRLGTRNN